MKLNLHSIVAIGCITNRSSPTIVGLLAALGLSLVPECLNAGSSAIPWSQIGAKVRCASNSTWLGRGSSRWRTARVWSWKNSGRKIAYGRLRVTDATGKELTARMEVKASDGEMIGETFEREVFDEGVEHDTHGACGPHDAMLAVVVNDAEAVYPVRIDPTFSDDNWVSMGGSPV
jgi:hypothetical protein